MAVFRFRVMRRFLAHLAWSWDCVLYGPTVSRSGSRDDARSPKVERTTRMLWAISDSGRPVHARGYICENTPGPYWWVPAIGYSTPRVFDTEADALAAAILEAEERAEKAAMLAADLRARAGAGS